MEGLEAVAELEELGGQEQEQQDATSENDQKAQEKSYRDFIKGLRDDDTASPHYKRIKSDYGRLLEVGRLDPKGVDGVRSTYEALKGVAFGDKQGIEAAREMQAALADSQQTLEAIADGNLETLSEDQRNGVMRMVPLLLDQLAEQPGDDYAKAVLPHFMGALMDSPLVGAYNQLVNILKQEPPSYLLPNQKADWQAEKFNGIIEQAKAMGGWFKAQEDRVKEFGTKTQNPQGQQQQQQTQDGPAAGADWWGKNVHAEMNTHVETEFTKELRPWADKLAKAGFRLSDAKKSALAQEFVSAATSEMKKDKNYTDQMGRYNKQKAPDANSVKATAKSAFNNVANRVMKDLIERDYGQVLTPKKVGQKTATTSTKPAVTGQTGLRIVTVKPDRSRIDFQRTPKDWILSDKYRLRDGTTVQYRP